MLTSKHFVKSFIYELDVLYAPTYIFRRKGLPKLQLNLNTKTTVVDPDLELRRGEGFDLLALLAFHPSVISSFSTQNKGSPGPSPRSATGLIPNKESYDNENVNDNKQS